MVLGDTSTATTFVGRQWKDAFRAATFGLKRVAYEGGPDFSNAGGASAIATSAIMTGRGSTPNMTDVFEQHHRLWGQFGGDVCCYYQIANDFKWSFEPVDVHSLGDPYQTWPAAPKQLAVQELAAESAQTPSLGTAIPGSVQGAAYAGTSTYYATPQWSYSAGAWTPSASGTLALSAGQWAGYAFNDSTGATRKITVTLSAGSGTAEVFLDGASLGTKAAAAGILDYGNQTLTAGMHGVIVRSVTGSATVSSVSFAAVAVANRLLPATLPFVLGGPSSGTSTTVAAASFLLHGVPPVFSSSVQYPPFLKTATGDQLPLKVWDGSQFIINHLRVWNGSQFN
jgi:hypothetical protein